MNWYTSDPHFGHEAIIWMNSRPFRNADEMNNTIINNFNSVVMPTDNLFILGDCSLHISLEETMALLDRIRCKNKYLIRGNHDKNFPEGYFKGVYNYLEVQDHDQWFVLEHYPLKTFKHQARGWIHLHGHQHNTLEYNLMNKENNLLIYDVGVDANFYMPVNRKQILDFFGKNTLQNPTADHHNKVDLIDKLKKEKMDLDSKILAVERFNSSKKFNEVSGKQRDGLRAQLSAMKAYDKALITRITDLEENK